MKHVTSFTRYLIRAQVVIGLMVVLCYSLFMNWYYVRGLDQSNLMDLDLQVKHWVDLYNQGIAPDLPNSIHFQGYLGWETLPNRVKDVFPELEYLTQNEKRDAKLKLNNGKVPFMPDTVLFVVAEPLPDGNQFYLVRSLSMTHHVHNVDDRLAEMFWYTSPLAILVLVIFLLSIRVIVNKITGPIAALTDWANTLSLEAAGKEPPDFRFSELNFIATLLQSNVQRISKLIANEKAFLSNASHELRTPIAIVKSNSELLSRLMGDKKYIKGIERIHRASINMEHMTETLLWLSRETKDDLDEEPIILEDLVQSLVKDNRYLLQSKDVSVTVSVKDMNQGHINIAATPCSIAISNLIRNAFQYTAKGYIHIEVGKGSVSIQNEDVTSNEEVTNSADYGYGLGLNLVEQIVKKMSWHYAHQELNRGRRVSLCFMLES